VSDPDRFPPGRSPYYIVTPRYIRTSAGIKALHLLCHCLNRVGQEAFLFIDPPWPAASATDSDLLTPLLSPAIIDRHKALGVSPIVVYPEPIAGNPLGAHTIIRYVLNFPGLLGGNNRFPPQEIIFGYSQILAAAGGAPEQILFIPASDATIFTPSAEPRERRGSCFWAMKYQQVHGGELLPVTADSVEITRDLPDSPEPATIAELFRRSEVFYAYENTALAIEAALCLCPTVFLPNPWLTELIAASEIGWDGFAWGTDPAEIARAKATVHLTRARYLSTYVRFWDQLSAFVTTTQTRAVEDTARWGFPRRMAWRLRWRPRIALAASLVHAQVNVSQHERMVATLRMLRCYWLFKFIYLPYALLITTLRTAGVRGVIRRTVSGLRRHRFLGFVRLLFGLGTTNKMRGFDE
jgi:hypothetical protein